MQNSSRKSAQRLTASMVSALVSVFGIYAILSCSTPYGINGFGTEYQIDGLAISIGAQRLTASMVSAPIPYAYLLSREEVLNALRHQWFRHRIFYPQNHLCPGAQRLTASMVSAPCSSSLSVRVCKCSTPYGINGFGTFNMSARDNGSSWCSTPYGINGFGTSNFCVPIPAKACAQRLTASMVSAPLQKRAVPPPKCVLNALRHQWFRH